MPDREKVISKLEKEVQRTYSTKTTVFQNGEKVSEEINTHREPCVRIPIEMADKILAMLKEQDNCENCAIAREDRRVVVLCKDCKHRSFYCTEATDGTTLYECHHPCANSVPRPGDWFCADGERRTDDARP